VTTESSFSATVLLVDDNPVNLHVLFQTLNGEGYKLLVAKSGKEALRIARQARPRLILLDIQMPDMDGYETCEQLQSDPATRDIAVIFLSALQRTESKVQGLTLGAVDYITKPFDVEEVLARVKRQLDIQHERVQLKEENRRLLTQTTRDSLSPAEREQWVKALIAEGESDRLEFKSTLRWDLKQDKAHAGIETAWLKSIAAFLNSDGGTLIVGVDDDGVPIGLDKDRFSSEDKYLLHVNNRIQQHIGPEHAQSVRFALEPIAGRKVLVVECQQSAAPAFLKQNNNEDFYIRVGPGTRKLSMSQMLAYVSERKEV
jgi:DNA-binding response OmpR family regulator